MNWGMKNRLSKTIDPKTGKSVMLAVDHGYFQGPTTGLRNLSKAITPLMPFANCLYITRGMVRNVVPNTTSVPIFLRVSGGPSILQEDLSDEHITVSMKE